jgi:DNA mismatch repair ATPase MutL
MKNSSKCLVKIRRLIQAYALARPAVRFRLHVLKAKNNKGDFIYAPNATSHVEDAVIKVIGKDCALQCDWIALESDGFDIHAFLPKPTANGAKIANRGAFISIDSRPVSNSRGTIKQLVAALKGRLRKSNPSLATVKDPFFRMNITCPPNSYDPNIEPAKDEVMFFDEKTVMSAVDNLLISYYPEAVVDMEHSEPPASTQTQVALEDEPLQTQSPARISIREDTSEAIEAITISNERHIQPRWRSSMYEIDEDDLEFLQENRPPVIEEEKDSRSAAVLNPWTIASMNAPVKIAISNGQLMSPAKSQYEKSVPPSSPTFSNTSLRKAQAEPLTPQTSSRMNATEATLDEELELSIRRLPSRTFEDYNEENMTEQAVRLRERVRPNVTQPEVIRSGQNDLQETTSEAGELTQSLVSARPTRARALPSQIPLPPFRHPHRTQRKQPVRSGELINASAQIQHDTWFGQPMQGSQPLQPSRRQKRNHEQDVPLFVDKLPSSPQRPALSAVERLAEPRLRAENNTDIRDFFEQNRPSHAQEVSDQSIRLSFTSINVPYQSSQQRPEATHLECDEMVLYNRPRTERGRRHSQPLSSRATLSDRLYADNDLTQRHNIGAPFHTYGRKQPLRPSSVDSLYGPAPAARDIRPSTGPPDMAAYFKAYQDRTTSAPTSSVHPRIPPAHETEDKSRPQSRSATDSLNRSKSSKLPLERVPHGFHIQNVVLTLATSVTSIVQSARKLDMSANALEWGYAAEDAGLGFAEPVIEERVTRWVKSVDDMLRGRSNAMEDMDVKRMLLEGIWRELSVKKREVGMTMVEDGRVRVLTGDAGAVAVTAAAAEQHEPKMSTRAEDETSEFDMSQFVEFDVGKYAEETLVANVVGPGADEVDDDAEDDDMLMDV